MYLKELILANFKNYQEAKLLFSSKVNCFVGNNGAGKTNILDGIHYLSFCKSYFNPVDSQNILHGEDSFSVKGIFLSNGEERPQDVHISLKNGRKKLRFNDKESPRLSDHIGRFPLVIITPSDRDLINLGSEERRRFVDSLLSQFNSVYLDNLIRYNKALKQRNTLLKQFAEQGVFQAEALELWDEQLMRYGKYIVKERKAFLKDFIPLFNQHFKYVSQDAESVDVEYISRVNEDNYLEEMRESRFKDRAVQYTTYGPHKDDLKFLINTYPVKRYGSQGQQKSFIVAIKLAQFEYTARLKNYKPVLLLDDIFDKLDENRVEQLIKLVDSDLFGQVFITDTQEERVYRIFNDNEINHKIFRVDHGKVWENNK